MAAVDRDIGEVADQARDEFARLVQLGQLQSDPLRYPIMAIGIAMDVIAKAAVEISEARQPDLTITDKQVAMVAQRLANTGVGLIATHVRNEFRKTWAILAASLLAAIMLGIAVGWFAWGRTPPLTCADQQGGRICWVWTSPPK